jgi:hypothetical protein
VWWWQLLCGAAFLLVGLLLDRAVRRDGDPGRRGRVAVLWTLNPLLLGQLVLGAHVDVLAAALAVAGLLLAARRRLLTGVLPAGLLLGAAVGTKAPYGLFGLAALWMLRGLPPRRRLVAVAVLGVAALAVLVPAHLWAGPHVFDQLRQASRFTSLATPWRAVVNLGDLVLGRGVLAPFVAPAALLLAAGLAVLLWRRTAPGPGAGTGPVADGARAALVLTCAWVLTAPYALPWYDAMVWAPLALAAPSAVDPVLARLLVARLAVLAVAYVPGRVVGLTPAVEALTLGVRRFVAPVLVLAVVVAVVRWATGASPHARRPGRRPPAPPPRPGPASVP